jgi:tetratricopeptide (TPR) repeat protein
MEEEHVKTHDTKAVKEKAGQFMDPINQQIADASKEMEDYLMSQSIPTPLQTPQQQAAHYRQQVKQMFDAIHIDLKRGVECYVQQALPDEKERLQKTFSKIFAISQALVAKTTPVPLNEEDYALFDTMATRTFVENQFKEASCMWRFLIQLQPENSRAWVGWAMAEQMNQNIDMVEHIYKMGLEILPYDVYLAMFAVDFYLSQSHPEKAREVISKAQEARQGVEGVKAEVSEELEKKLAEIQQFEKEGKPSQA